MRVDPCLLLCAAALLADSASAAEANPRPRGLNRRDQRFYPSSNSSTSAAAPTLPPPALTSLTSTELQDASRQRSSSSCTSSSSSDVDAEPAPSSPQSRSTWPPTTLPTSSLTSHQPSNASVSGSPSGPATPVSPSSPSFTDHASRNSTHAMTPPSTQPSNGTVTITTSRSRNHTTTRHPHGPVVSVTIDCPATINPSDCTGRGYLTVNYTRSDPTSTEKCTPVTDSHRPLTEFSVVYTSTITFYGNRTDYTPPYEPIRTPKYCAPTIVPAIPPGFTVSPKILTSDIAKESSRGGELVHPSTLLPFITFITTDKNPSVVYPSDPVPNYSPTWGQVGDGGPGDGSHKTVGRGGNGGGDPHKTPDADSITAAPRPTFKVTARGTQVVINDKTFAGLNPGQTSLVTVDGGTFTIYPSAVIGEGATIQKPPPPGTGVQVATPTAAVVGGLPVTLSGSHAIVGGATMTIPETASTTVIDGHSVSIGPGSLVVGGQSLSFKHVAPSRETDVVVSGGELLTAIGRSVVVIHSTTFTYGPGIPETSQVIQDDTISIGPSGVIVHGTLIGGQAAGPTATSYEIVGGATITRIAPSIAVINGKTFTVGPGTEWTTTVIAGQTWTVGPTGLVGSSMTFKYPFGTAVTTTISPTGTWLNDFPIETAGQNRGGDDDDSSGTSLRPNLWVGWTAFCIAIGVWVLA